MELHTIVASLLITSANALALIVWGLLTKARKDIEELKKEIAMVKFNYLDRFQDLKDVIQQFELNFMQRITILETKICKDKN